MNREIARPVVASSRRVTTVATVRRNQRRRPTGTGADPAWACRTVEAYGVGVPPPAAALTRIDPLPTGADPSAGGGTPTPYASTVRHAHAGSAPVPVGRRRWFRRTVATVVALLLLATTGLAIYLFMSASGWRDQAKSYLGSSLE